MRQVVFFSILLISFSLLAQRNCNTYKLKGDILKYKACKEVEETRYYHQFSKEYQQILDESLQIDPTYADAYRYKSVAYLKSGDFITWKKLIDKAVKFDPKDNLGYRGWCRYQFFRDYEGAIKDIEELERIVDYDIGYCQNGDYHLNIVKALCYKGIGNFDTAIEIIEKQLASKKYTPELYDHYHLGILYFEKQQYKKALDCFQKQKKENDVGDNEYYLGLTYRKLNERKKYALSLLKAKELYTDGFYMRDNYTHQSDKVYLLDIEKELQSINSNIQE